MGLKFRLKGLAETFIDKLKCPGCGNNGGEEGDNGFGKAFTENQSLLVCAMFNLFGVLVAGAGVAGSVMSIVPVDAVLAPGAEVRIAAVVALLLPSTA
jgi:phosphate/sulfate permease